MSKEEQKVLDLYQKEKWSTYEIAEKLGTYPNKVRRILKINGVSIRSRSKAQKNALKKGRASHPTEGVEMSADTKLKISESQGRVWDLSLIHI